MFLHFIHYTILVPLPSSLFSFPFSSFAFLLVPPFPCVCSFTRLFPLPHLPSFPSSLLHSLFLQFLCSVSLFLCLFTPLPLLPFFSFYSSTSFYLLLPSVILAPLPCSPQYSIFSALLFLLASSLPQHSSVFLFPVGFLLLHASLPYHSQASLNLSLFHSRFSSHFQCSLSFTPSSLLTLSFISNLSFRSPLSPPPRVGASWVIRRLSSSLESWRVRPLISGQFAEVDSLLSQWPIPVGGVGGRGRRKREGRLQKKKKRGIK